jgi:hypothetical protein
MANIPKLYEKIKSPKRFPVYVPGEQYSFYINFERPISDGGFNNFRLHLISCENDSLIENFANLEKDQVNEAQYNIYAEFTFPVAADGVFKFGIWDNSQNKYKAISNTFTIYSDVTKTAVLKYRSPYDYERFGYSRLPEYFNVFRLPLILIDLQYESQKSQYRNVSDRKFRNYRSYRDKVIKVESYYFDENSHEAISCAYEHEVLIINDQLFVPKGGYEIDEIPDRDTKKGSIELYADSSSRAVSGVLPPVQSDRVIIRLGSANGPVVLQADAGSTVIVSSPYQIQAYQLNIL